LLPRSTQDLLRTKDRRPHPDAVPGFWVTPSGDPPEVYCHVVTTAEARTIAEALDRAGYERDNPAGHWVLEYFLEAPAPINRGFIVFEPIFPHGGWGCSGCG
jgi:hypothetical protein